MSFSPNRRSWVSRLNPFVRHAEQTPSRRPAAPRTTFRPSLEALEDRCVPTVQFFGGPLIPNVEVNTLFLGQQWEPSAPNSLNNYQQGLNSYLQTLVNSPYMDMLAQYNVGRGGFGSTGTEWLNSDPNMQSPMDDYHTSYAGGLTELQSMIVNAIQQGWVSAPNANQLYVVFLPPGEQELSPQGAWNTQAFLGYHWSFNSQYGPIYYAVLPFPGGSNPSVQGTPTAFDSLTTVVSHELSEAVTDPVVGTGWYDRQNNGEIGDIVEGQIVYWNGYVVQQEANPQDQGMVPALPASGAANSVTANQLSTVVAMNFADASTTVFGDTTARPLGGSPLPGSSFLVTINWGDGQTSDGTVSYDGNGSYTVFGKHSYAQPGNYVISVSATDAYGMTASAESTVNVAPGQTVPPPGITPPPVVIPPPPPSPMQLFFDGYTLAIDLLDSGGLSAAMADTALMQQINAAPGGFFNPYLDAGLMAALSAL